MLQHTKPEYQLSKAICFEGVKHFERPFRHHTIDHFFEDNFANQFSNWLATDAPWNRSRSGFYDQHELNLKDATQDPAVAHLLDCKMLAEVRRRAEKLFDVPFHPYIKVSAHKLIPGQGIGLHNDGDQTQESHRIVVQLSRGLTLQSGGALVLFRSTSLDDVAKLVLPRFNTAFAFQLGGPAYHAVAELRDGERYSLLFSLWKAEESDLKSGSERLQKYFFAHD